MTSMRDPAPSELDDLATMWRLRVFEEQVRELRMAGEIVGSVHLAIGQEAGPVGVVPLVGTEDTIFATYRGHGWALACGVPAEQLFAELLGRASGINGGRGGSAYLTAPGYRFFGENSIVGAGAPIATGSALAGKFDGSGRVSITVFGDGALNQGSVHEAMNFASAMKLPVVFFCENNTWSEMTPTAAMVGQQELFRRAAGYGMAGVRVDGNDPAAVREVTRQATELARSGGGPTLVESLTTRLAGHYIGDIEHYRSAADRESAIAADPIPRLASRLGSMGTPSTILDKLERAAREEMTAAVARALSAPLADPTTAREHIYV
jgi:TPP-dependent pyruvate/acetoin dehydrogenase alpha subunit